MELRRWCRMHDARAGLQGAFRTLNQRLYELMAEARDSVATHVAADHAVGQSRLKRLIDHAAIVPEIVGAARHERVQRDVFRHTAAPRFQHPRTFRRFGEQLDLPHPLAAITPVPLEHPRTGCPQTRRKLGAEGLRRSIDMRVSAPTETPGSMKALLHAHLQDDVGVSADPDAPSRDLAQHRVEHGPGPAVGNRVDPDQDSRYAQELRAHLVDHVIGIHRGFGADIAAREGLKDPAESARLGRCRLACLAVPSPQQRHRADFLGHDYPLYPCSPRMPALRSPCAMWARADASE